MQLNLSSWIVIWSILVLPGSGTDICSSSSITSSSGSITSPNYPRSYPGTRACTITISRPLNYRVKFIISNINLKRINNGSQVLCLDSLTISGGTSKQFCGNETSSTFVPYTNVVTLTLKTSGLAPLQGFYLRFTIFYNNSQPPAFSVCSKKTISSDAGRIYSPGFPFGYNSNLRCSVTIMIPEDKSLEVVLNFIDIYRYYYYYDGCHYEELIISDGTYSNSTCGKSFVNSPPIFFTKENINVSFRSSYWRNSLSGFLLTFRVIDAMDIQCTFENDLCNFTKIGGWQRVSGSYLANLSIADHTIGDAYGHFVTMETSSLERQKNGTVKRNLPANGNLACLTYWYRSFGYTSNILNVYVIGNGKELALEKKLLGIEKSWKKGNMTIYVNHNRFSIIFEAMVNSYPGYIALDDVFVDIGECLNPGDCNFENGISNSKCPWKNVGFPLDNFDWIVHSGYTPYYGSGPNFDRKGSTIGKYIYMGRYYGSMGSKSWLVSNYFNTSTKCFTFWYHMYGSTVGSLNIYEQSIGEEMKPIWTLSGNKGNVWIRGQVTANFGVGLKSRIIVEGVKGYTSSSYIALDDFKFFDGPCDILPLSATPPRFGIPINICPSRTITLSKGHIVSPNYYPYYSFYASCTLTIRQPLNTVLNFSFSYISLDSFVSGNQKRCRDSLTISGGTSKQFCNNKSSVTFSPYTSVVVLTFNAHLNQRFKGFALEFTSTRNNNLPPAFSVCYNKTISSDAGRIYSPGFPFGYNPRLRCSVTVVIPEDKSLEVVLNFIDIYRYYYYYDGCHDEELMISDGTYSNSTCGKSFVNSPPIFFTKENITVSYHSYYWWNSLSGFLLTFRVVDAMDIQCTFENDLCNFTKIGAWQRVSGSYLANFSIVDHTIGDAYGHFVTMETSSLERQKNGTVKRNLPANGNSACLTYWYQSFGYTPNILKVYVIGNGKELALEKRLLGIETSWKKGNMTIYVNHSHFSINFEAMVNSYPGYIALDDIFVDVGECLNPGDCNFENGISNSKCPWKNVGYPLDNFDWIVHSGSTPYYGTGPNFDRKRSTIGKYIYMGRYYGSMGSKSWLVSDYFNTSTKCFTFWYHMYGSTVGSLNIYEQSIGDEMKPLWTLSGNKGNVWIRGQVTANFGVGLKSRIIVEGVKGYTSSSYIALDDFKFFDGPCDILPLNATPSHFGIPINICPTRTVTLSKGLIVSPNYYPYYSFRASCTLTIKQPLNTVLNFSFSYISLDSFVSGNQKRCRDSLTISGGTSKQFCNNKSSLTFSPYTSVVVLTFNALLNQRFKGFALEFTSTRNKNQPPAFSVCYNKTIYSAVGRIYSPGFPFGYNSNLRCSVTIMIPEDKSLEVVLNFIDINRYYYYYNGCPNEELIISDGTYSNSTCRKSFVNSPPIFFTKENINVSFRSYYWSNSLSGFLLTFRVVDAMDIQCTFENDLCNFTKIGGWQRVSGPYLGNLSIVDHTIGDAYGYFVAMETSNLERQKTGTIKRSFTANGNLACLTFWYQSFGYTSNVLKVYVMANGKKISLWSRSLGILSSWKKGNLTIQLSHERFSIIFEAMVNSYPGYIALDDVFMDMGECNNPGDCSFESGINNIKCLWRNVVFPLDNYDWTVHSGSSPYYGYGPSFDRNGSTTGKYIYMNGYYGYYNSKSWLVSNFFNTSTKCFTFWYYMHGWNIGSLNIYEQSMGTEIRPLWTLRGNRGNLWHQGHVTVNFTNGQQIRVIVEGLHGLSHWYHYGGIALDDFMFADGPCDIIPKTAKPSRFGIPINICPTRTITLSKGHIESLNYYLVYYFYESCSLTIRQPLNRVFNFTFSHISLNHFVQDNQTRCIDSLTISGGTSKQFCTNTTSMTFSPYTNIVVLTFNAYLNRLFKGFSLQFESTKSNNLPPAFSVCSNNTISNNVGRIHSPGFPFGYKTETRCSVAVAIPTGKWLEIVVNFIDIRENSFGCVHDELLITDGRTSNSTCGKSLVNGRPLFFNNSKVNVSFRSSYWTSSKSGFLLTFRVLNYTDTNECTKPDICPQNRQCVNTFGSFTCQCLVGFTGVDCTKIPDAYILITVTLSKTYTESLNDLTSKDSQALINELKAYLRKNYYEVPQYRGFNVIEFRRGSVIVDGELVFVKDSENTIMPVLREINNSGNLANYSFQPGSLQHSNLPPFSNIAINKITGGYAGYELELSCEVIGPSLPIFEWRNGSKTLSLSSRVRVETKNKVSRLFVRKSEKSDSGVYSCIVTKGEDRISHSMYIKIRAPPVVTVSPLSLTVTKGNSITLFCNVLSGYEEDISILWFNSSAPYKSMQSGRQLHLTNLIHLGNKQRVTFQYWCNATNSDGTTRSKIVTVVVVSKGFNQFCSAESSGGYAWNKTAVDINVVQNCLSGKQGYVYRLCSKNADGKPNWGFVNNSGCRSVDVIELVDQVKRLDSGFASNNVSEIIQKTEKITKDGELFEQDVEDIVFVLEKTQTKTATQSDRQNFIRSSSNIVKNEKKDVWINIPNRNKLVRKIISGADLNARKFVAMSNENGIITFSTQNIQVLGIKLPENPPSETIRLLDITGGGGVVIPGAVAVDISQATVVKYSSIKNILSPKELQKSVDNKTIKASINLTIQSTLVSFSTTPELKNISQPIKIVLQNNQSGFVDPNRTCVFTEPQVTNSEWSGEGCVLNEIESSKENVTCACDHNTAFAIMMDVPGVKSTETERKVLELISTIGCSISLMGVILTILMQICFWKKVKSLRSKVLINLCVAISFTDIFAILEGVARDNSDFCKVVAASLHFFVLSVFGWMLCEGILLYIKLIRVFDNDDGKYLKIFYFIGWGIPLLVVSISFGVTKGVGYGGNSFCWLEDKLIWAFVVPAILIVMVNTVVFIMVIRILINSQSVQQQDNMQKVKTGVKAAMVLLPVLGLTWVFGLMTFNHETMIFRYLFAILNSTQGLLIFLFHCVLNKEMRQLVKNRTDSTFPSSARSTRRLRKGSSTSQGIFSSSTTNLKSARKNSNLNGEENEWQSQSIYSTTSLQGKTHNTSKSSQPRNCYSRDNPAFEMDIKVSKNAV